MKLFLALIFSIPLGTGMAFGNDYIACPADFVRFHKELDYKDGVFYKFSSKLSDKTWQIAKTRGDNVIPVSEYDNKIAIEAIYYADAPVARNYFLVKSSKYSKGREFGKSLLVGYGEKLKQSLRREFGKRFPTRYFKRDATANVDLETYQDVHLSDLPAGSSLVSKARYLFDQRRGWHLTFKDRSDTFSDITVRNNFAFPQDMVAEETPQKHFLEAFLQRYGGPGKVCARIKLTLSPIHDGLFLEFYNIADATSPVPVEFALELKEQG